MKKNIIISLLVFLISFIFLNLYKENYSVIGVRFNFSGVETGKYNDGKYFDEQDLISKEILKSVYDNFDFLSHINFHEFSRAFEVKYVDTINEVKTAESKLKDNLNVTRRPDRLFIEFRAKLDNDKKSLVLNSVVDKFKLLEIEPRLYLENLSDDYLVFYPDYLDLNKRIYFLDSKLTMFDSFLRRRIGNRINTFGEYSNILIENQLFRRIELKRLKDLLEDNRVVLDYDISYSILEEKLKSLELAKRKKNGELEVLQEILKNYRPEQDSLVLFNENNRDEITVNSERTYYTKLIEKTTTANIDIAKLNEEIAYVKQEMNELKLDDDLSNEIKSELDRLALIHNNRIHRTNNLIDYEKLQYYVNYMSIDEVLHKDSLSMKKMFFLGLILSGFSFFTGIILDKKHKKY